MSRILTGIQSTGVPHLGNILGAIKPMIHLSNQPEHEAFAFIADLHSLTSIKNAEERKQYVRAVSAAWLACEFDTEKNTLYRQSDVPEVTELAWYLSCFTPFPMLANAHSFKDKSERLNEVNAGLFTYPVLMAADIIGYDAEIVPVGKDQLQHIEITRDIAGSFNHTYGDTFVIPAPFIQSDVMVLPGIDGRKMSKSYNNTINIFLPEKELKKVIMSIQTDSTPIEEPKNPDRCNVYQIFKHIAPEALSNEMHTKYLQGGYGYGQAKTALFEYLRDNFSNERARYIQLMEHPEQLDTLMLKGADKARHVISNVIQRVRERLGFN